MKLIHLTLDELEVMLEKTEDEDREFLFFLQDIYGQLRSQGSEQSTYEVLVKEIGFDESLVKLRLQNLLAREWICRQDDDIFELSENAPRPELNKQAIQEAADDYNVSYEPAEEQKSKKSMSKQS